ncbi:MAG: Lrp/AsnC family transcriptional regulator [Phormidesmis priestleyi]|uniref:Lrp/AsnC family transcriptional regulator n=1 Tax=Phormidesmis priestleyi TaxID=268141 RepID=A0A2W4XML1_9CYAN|nr:MAG: Lrp/AsnC family transcriptional regulator [Phormidesmis priestleyi]
MSFDELDVKILAALSQDGRVRWSALADRFGVSAPAIADHVRRLENSGIITGYSVQINAVAVGLGLIAFVSITLDHPRHRADFLNYVQHQAHIQSCHHVIGESDYLLKICCASTADLERILTEEIKALPGIQQTRTTIALSSVKDTAALPIDEPN